MGEELGCLSPSPTAAYVGMVAVLTCSCAVSTGRSVLACSCAVSTGRSVDASPLMGFGMTGRMAVVRLLDDATMVFYESLTLGRQQIVEAMENVLECTTRKDKINGDDCGRGRDNVCI